MSSQRGLAHDTIVALSSPPGQSLRALLRLSGPAALEVLVAHGLDGATPQRVAHSGVLDLDPLRVPVLWWWMDASRSFTGQTTSEVLLAGSPTLVQIVTNTLLKHPDVRRAGAGEFSARAARAGRLSLAQADALAASLAAESEEQRTLARTLTSAGTPAHAWLEEATTMLALVEAGIDFTDQDDVVAIAPADLARRSRAIIDAIEPFAGRSPVGGRVGEQLPRVALVGPPNAGKSTLFNALLGRARAVESHNAGSTRDVLREPVTLAGQRLLLLDLPGLDEARTSPVQHAADRAIREADLLVWCDAFARWPGSPESALRVRTKADRRVADAPGSIAVCARTGSGVDELAQAIASHATARQAATLGAVLPRHADALARVLAALGAVCDWPDAPLDLQAQQLRDAVAALRTLAGGSDGIDPDELLGRIFARFCVGK